MPGNIATAYVEVLPSTQGITSNLEEAFGGAGEKAGKKSGVIAGKSFVAKLGKTLVAAGAVKAVTKFFKDAINQGAKLQQSIGGTEAVFGHYAWNVQYLAEKAYKNMGLSAADYMATANKMGALFQGSGMEQVEAMRLSTKAMQRAADVASVMGIETSAAMEAIAGAAKGNFTMMDNLGVAMNATTLQAYALEKGINFEWNTASQAEKARLAMEMFFERTAQYAGNFAKEAEDTIAGSIGMLKSSWADFLAILTTGEDVTQAMRNVVDSVVAVGKNILPAVFNIFDGINTIIADTIALGADKIDQLLTSAMNTVIPIIGGALNRAKTDISKALAGIKNDIRGAMASIATSVFTTWGSIKSGVASAWAAISGAVSGAWDALVAGVVWDSVTAAVGSAWSAIQGAVAGAWSAIQAAVQQAWNNVTNIDFGSIAGKVSAAWASIEGAVGAAWDAIKQAVSSKIEEVKGLLSFDWKLPEIKLPEIPTVTVTGVVNWVSKGLSGLTGGGGVKWHATAMDRPYVFSEATLFGAGEVGDEVLYGRNALMRDISVAANSGNTGVERRLDAVIDGLQTLQAAMENMGVYLDGDKLVGGIIDTVDNALGQRDALTARGMA